MSRPLDYQGPPIAKPTRAAVKVATVAGRCTAGLFAAAAVSCGFGAAPGFNLEAMLVAFLLVLLALAALVVWVTARDIAADEPPKPDE